MPISKLVAVATLVTAMGVGAAGAAESTVALHVRSGPSTGYPVIDTLYAGESVRVDACSGGWCQITHNGPDGWASERYLADIGGSPSSPPPRTNNGNNGPDVNFAIDTPGFSFSVGNGGSFGFRRGHHNGRVCFYKNFDFRGRHFCARPGSSDATLHAFNDEISSIRVTGDAQVKVCEDYHFNGRCAVLDHSRRALRGRNNDIISSYRVR